MGSVNTLVALAFVALNIDVLLQNVRLHQLRESVDISRAGVSLRLAAVTMLAIKFGLIHETTLLLGQSILVLNVAVYLWQVWNYHRKKRRKPNKR